MEKPAAAEQDRLLELESAAVRFFSRSVPGSGKEKLLSSIVGSLRRDRNAASALHRLVNSVASDDDEPLREFFFGALGPQRGGARGRGPARLAPSRENVLVLKLWGWSKRSLREVKNAIDISDSLKFTECIEELSSETMCLQCLRV